MAEESPGVVYLCYYIWSCMHKCVCVAAGRAEWWGSSHSRRDGRRWNSGRPQRPPQQTQLRKPLHWGGVPYGRSRVSVFVHCSSYELKHEVNKYLLCTKTLQCLQVWSMSQACFFLFSLQHWPSLQLPIELPHHRHWGLWPAAARRDQPALRSPTVQRPNPQEVNSHITLYSHGLVSFPSLPCKQLHL